MFSSKQPIAGGRAAKAGAPRLSFIGAEVVISGDLATDAQLHLDGRIDGNVRCARLCQGGDGIISGNIVADEARIAGIVEGMVSASTVAVEATARILGDIVYDTISIAAGARIEGRLGRRGAATHDDPAQTPLIAAPVSFSTARPAESGLIAVAEAL